MSTNARTPDGFKKVADAVQSIATITVADSPYDLPVDTYLFAESGAGVVDVNLPSAKTGDILTIAHPAGVTNDVNLNAATGEVISLAAGALTSTVALDTNGVTSFRATRGIDGLGDPFFAWVQI